MKVGQGQNVDGGNEQTLSGDGLPVVYRVPNKIGNQRGFGGKMKGLDILYQTHKQFNFVYLYLTQPYLGFRKMLGLERKKKIFLKKGTKGTDLKVYRLTRDSLK